MVSTAKIICILIFCVVAVISKPYVPYQSQASGTDLLQEALHFAHGLDYQISPITDEQRHLRMTLRHKVIKTPFTDMENFVLMDRIPSEERDMLENEFDEENHEYEYVAFD